MEMSHPQARGTTRRSANSRRYVKKTANRKLRTAARQAMRNGNFDALPFHSREVYDAAWELY